LDEVSYRRAFQYMYFKRWRTSGEPYEPSFQEPELFVGAIKALASGRRSLTGICQELHLSSAVFTEITGIVIDPAPSAQATVLKFPPRPKLSIR
jgi:hypothetical protein